MAEDPIKLFSTRAERYPEPTEADVALGAGRAALAAIPFVGGSITEVLSLVLAPAVARRRDAWFKELADGLDLLEARKDGFRVENLQHDENFVSAVIEASRSAVSTHKQEKRKALRNALLNIALHRSTDNDQQQMFLRYIEELTVWHLRMLALMQNIDTHPTAMKLQKHVPLGRFPFVLKKIFPELREEDVFYEHILSDLHRRGLLEETPRDLNYGEIMRKHTTPIADAFLAFIADPLA